MERINLNDPVLIKDHTRFCKVLSEAETLRSNKLQDYGQSYKNFGLLGVVVRMDDKMARMKNILKNKKAMNESLRDSLIDILNYAAMGVMIIDEETNNV